MEQVLQARINIQVYTPRESRNWRNRIYTLHVQKILHEEQKANIYHSNGILAPSFFLRCLFHSDVCLCAPWIQEYENMFNRDIQLQGVEVDERKSNDNNNEEKVNRETTTKRYYISIYIFHYWLYNTHVHQSFCEIFCWFFRSFVVNPNRDWQWEDRTYLSIARYIIV